MKKNRFIMRSALFTLVLGFGFLNYTDASSTTLVSKIRTGLDKNSLITQYKDVYQQAIQAVIADDRCDNKIDAMNHKIESWNTDMDKTLDSDTIKKFLADNKLTKEDIYFPYIRPIYTEIKSLNKEIESFVELLKKYNESQVLGIETIPQIINKIVKAKGVISVLPESTIMTLSDKFSNLIDCVANKTLEQYGVGANVKSVICDKTLEGLKVDEKLQEFKSRYSDLYTKIENLNNYMLKISSLCPDSEKPGNDFYKLFTKNTTTLKNMQTSIQVAGKDPFVFLSYMQELNNLRKDGKDESKTLFSIDLENLTRTKVLNILLNKEPKEESKEKSKATITSSTKTKTSSKVEEFKKLLEDDSAAPTAAKLTSVAVDEATTKVVTEEKTGDTLETKKEIKKITKKEVKKAPAAPVAASDAPAIAPAAGSDDKD